MDAISMGEEPLHERIDEAKPLLLRHWSEAANYQDVRPLDPDYDKYCELSRIGLMRAFVVRYNAPPAVVQKPIGYAVFLVAPTLHYKGWKCARNDLFWVDPDFRGQRIGTRMFLAVEKWLATEVGAHLVLYEVKHHLNPKGELFQALGYQLRELVFEKVLRAPGRE